MRFFKNEKCDKRNRWPLRFVSVCYLRINALTSPWNINNKTLSFCHSDPLFSLISCSYHNLMSPISYQNVEYVPLYSLQRIVYIHFLFYIFFVKTQNRCGLSFFWVFDHFIIMERQLITTVLFLAFCKSTCFQSINLLECIYLNHNRDNVIVSPIYFEP